MFWSRKTSVKDESIRWLLDNATWWTFNFGGFASLRDTPIVLPTDDFFVLDPSLGPHELAGSIFDAMVVHARMEEWNIELSYEDEIDPGGAVAHLPHHFSSRDMRRVDEGPTPIPEGAPLVVPYTLRGAEDPVALVCTMGRALSHYLLYEASQPLPVPDEQRDLLVELGAVLMGFGVFLANGAFRFKQFTSGNMYGWQHSSSNLLSQAEVAYALAILVEAIEAADADVLRYLEANPRAYFKAARSDLRKRWRAELDGLRATAPGEGGPFRSVSGR